MNIFHPSVYHAQGHTSNLHHEIYSVSIFGKSRVRKKKNKDGEIKTQDVLVRVKFKVPI